MCQSGDLLSMSCRC